jgi:hypothetical protein
MTPLADDFASIALELKRIEAEKAEKQEEYSWANFNQASVPDYDGA